MLSLVRRLLLKTNVLRNMSSMCGLVLAIFLGAVMVIWMLLNLTWLIWYGMLAGVVVQ